MLFNKKRKKKYMGPEETDEFARLKRLTADAHSKYVTGVITWDEYNEMLQQLTKISYALEAKYD